MSSRLLSRLVFIFPLTLLGLSACQTVPKKLSTLSEGRWEARALVQDKAHSRSYIVNLHFNAIKNSRFRMDVTSALDQSVASLVNTPSEVKYVLLRSKRFYVGKPGPQALKPILSIPLDPRWIDNILFEMPISEANWTCVDNKDGLLKECSNPVQKIKISWGTRKGPHRTVDITAKTAEVQINFHTFWPKVETRAHLFELSPPKGFRLFKVR